MNLYVESSALASWLLAQPEAAEVHTVLRRAADIVSSDLTAVECERALRRLVASGEITEAQGAERRGQLYRASASWSWLRVGTDVIERARGGFPAEPVRPSNAPGRLVLAVHGDRPLQRRHRGLERGEEG